MSHAPTPSLTVEFCSSTSCFADLARRPGSVPAARWRPSPPTQVLRMCQLPPLPFPAACFLHPLFIWMRGPLWHVDGGKTQRLLLTSRMQLPQPFGIRSHQPATYLSPGGAAASLSPGLPVSQGTNTSTRPKGKIPKSNKPSSQRFKRGQLPKLGGHGRVDRE